MLLVQAILLMLVEFIDALYINIASKNTRI